MGKFSLTLLAAAIGLAASQASAADLPRKAPAYSPPPPPVASWTGCYIGGNVGGAFAHIDVTDVVTGVNGSRTRAALLAAVRSAAITSSTIRGWSAFAICSTGQTFTAAEHLPTQLTAASAPSTQS